MIELVREERPERTEERHDMEEYRVARAAFWMCAAAGAFFLCTQHLTPALAVLALIALLGLPSTIRQYRRDRAARRPRPWENR